MDQGKKTGITFEGWLSACGPTTNRPTTHPSKFATWSHKNTYLWALAVRHHFMYLTARSAAVSKRNVH